jgi:hypothetical protein
MRAAEGISSAFISQLAAHGVSGGVVTSQKEEALSRRSKQWWK